MGIMERSRNYTPSHTPSRTVWRIYAPIKKTIFTFSVCTDYFVKEIENIIFAFLYVNETFVEVWENSKLRGNTRPVGS